MRRFAPLAPLLLVIAAPAFAAGAAVAATCFGLPPTNPDHRGAIAGTAGDDVLIGDGQPNSIDGGWGGTDRICGGGGGDLILSAGVLHAHGDAGPDEIGALGPGHHLRHGDDGNDTLDLSEETATSELRGGAGDDRLAGNEGDDRLVGGGSDDTLIGSYGLDALDGGPGTDRCRVGPDGGTARRCE